MLAAEAGVNHSWPSELGEEVSHELMIPALGTENDVGHRQAPK